MCPFSTTLANAFTTNIRLEAGTCWGNLLDPLKICWWKGSRIPLLQPISPKYCSRDWTLRYSTKSESEDRQWKQGIIWNGYSKFYNILIVILINVTVFFYRSPGGDLGAKKKKKKQKRKKEKPNSGGTKSDSASDSQEIKIQQPSKVRACLSFSCITI